MNGLKCAGNVCAVVASLLFAGCSKSSNPAAPAPTEDPIFSQTRTMVFSESFEGDLTLDWVQFYKKQGLQPMDYLPQSTVAHKTGTRSVSSDSGNTALMRNYSRTDSGITGVEFYMMASSAGHINFIGAIGKAGSSNMGTKYYVGMGFDASDSVKFFYFVNNYIDTAETCTTIAPITYGKWYKCTIEYMNGTERSVRYYLDGVKVGTYVFPDPEPDGPDMMVMWRNTAGSPGPEPYYIDDAIVYKR